MHCWGDEWFTKYGDSFYKAIHKLESRIRSWAKVGISGKEKWGTYRDEYLTLWDGGITQLFFGYRATYQYNPISRILYRIDHYLIPIHKTKYGWRRVGLADLNRFLGITGLVHRWQSRMINKAFQVTCWEYPQFIDELICDVDCYEMIKPCQWGDIDGTEIHGKYWSVVQPARLPVQYICVGLACPKKSECIRHQKFLTMGALGKEEQGIKMSAKNCISHDFNQFISK